jgi:hypothetical protein
MSKTLNIPSVLLVDKLAVTFLTCLGQNLCALLNSEGKG